jgi:hypothetical protein
MQHESPAQAYQALNPIAPDYFPASGTVSAIAVCYWQRPEMKKPGTGSGLFSYWLSPINAGSG